MTKDVKTSNLARHSLTELKRQLSSYEKKLQILSRFETSNLKSFNEFLHHGASQQEIRLISSIKQVIYEHLMTFFYPLSSSSGYWKKYCKRIKNAKSFEFFPAKIANSIRVQICFQERITHTQLFLGYLEGLRNADAAKLIADWLYFR